MSDLDVSKNPALLFDFNADHNGVKCIASLKPEDQGTERQDWFTAQMLAKEFSCTDETIRKRVKILLDTGDLNEAILIASLNIKNENGNGAVKTTLYNITVLNKVAMTFIDNFRAVEMRKAFNDVLVREETNSVDKPKQNLQIPKDYSSALRLAADLWDKNMVLEAEKHELELNNKSLKAQNGVLSQDCELPTI